MPVYEVAVLVLNKRSARDPEGETLAHELKAHGLGEGLHGVRAGKVFVLSIEAGGPEEAASKAMEIASKARLYNPLVHEAEALILAPRGGDKVPRD